MAVETLTGLGVTSGWVNAGGDMRAFGGASPLIRRREADGTLTSLGRLGDGAIASSARRAMPNNRYPGWIVGRECPAEDSVWTVISNTAWRADALTKVAALAGPEERVSLISRLGGHLVIPALEDAA
jgi:thiamine biosynthesis lipoprotein